MNQSESANHLKNAIDIVRRWELKTGIPMRQQDLAKELFGDGGIGGVMLVRYLVMVPGKKLFSLDPTTGRVSSRF